MSIDALGEMTSASAKPTKEAGVLLHGTFLFMLMVFTYCRNY